MTFGEKLSRLRRERNYTQEQLAERLGVSRQTVSKWESNVAFPETEKLIRISEIFDCSLDYLLKDAEEGTVSTGGNGMTVFRSFFRERKSKRVVFGMPLWHIGRNAKGVFAVGFRARGLVSVGLLSVGLVSFGLLSLGLLSFGVLTLGLLSVGVFSAGLLAIGSVALGLIAVGAVAVGLFSLGACSIGQLSVGAFAVGNYFAMGDHAEAMIAIGDTKAVGTVFEAMDRRAGVHTETVSALLDEYVPAWLAWAKLLVKLFI